MKMIFLILILLFTISISADNINNKKYIEENNIVYNTVGDIKLLMDMKTLDDGKKNKPAVIAIHGGGWWEGSKTDGMWMGNPLVEKGYTVFAINYRLAPVAPFPAQIEDCKSAVRFVRANAKKYNIDPNKIIAYGGSAGGHLASLLGVLPKGKFEGTGNNLKTSSAVQAVISNVGPEDLSLYTETDDKYAIRENNFKQLFGSNPEGMDYWIKAASPITYVTEKSVPHLLLYGSTDDLVPASHGAVMEKKLKDNKVYCEYYVEEGAWHILSTEYIIPKIDNFLEKILK